MPPPRRFQFSLRALLILMFGVGCFFAGVSWQRQLDKPVYWGTRMFGSVNSYEIREIVMPDGETWQCTVESSMTGWKRTGQLTPDEIAEARAQAEYEGK